MGNRHWITRKTLHGSGNGLAGIVHLLRYVDNSIRTSKGIHCVANAHDPSNAPGPSANTVELEEEAAVVEAIGHGTKYNSDDDESSNGEVETHLGPFTQMTLRDGEDGDHYCCSAWSLHVLHAR